MNYEQWRARFPLAAREFETMINSAPRPTQGLSGVDESRTQQAVRFKSAKAGKLMWRNNVGVTPHECHKCRTSMRPIRYGLCNDSHEMNKRFKSSDLIGITPVLITPAHVGRTIGQFTAIETKRDGWVFKGEAREVAQAAYIGMVQQKGGIGYFSTGDLNE